MNDDDPIYCHQNIPLFESLYGKNLISLGEYDSVEDMFFDINLINLKALDIGFGLGGIAFYLAKKYDMNISGVELNSWMADYASKNAPHDTKYPLKFSTYNHDGSIPYETESFDLVYSKGVLNHVTEKQSLFQEVYRVLKLDGLFIIMDWVFPEIGVDTTRPLVRETEESYRKFLKKSGFQNITFRNNSHTYSRFVENFIKNLSTQQKFIEEKYNKEFFDIVWKQHQDLLQNVLSQKQFAMRIIAHK